MNFVIVRQKFHDTSSGVSEILWPPKKFDHSLSIINDNPEMSQLNKLFFDFATQFIICFLTELLF